MSKTRRKQYEISSRCIFLERIEVKQTHAHQAAVQNNQGTGCERKCHGCEKRLAENSKEAAPMKTTTDFQLVNVSKLIPYVNNARMPPAVIVQHVVSYAKQLHQYFSTPMYRREEIGCPIA